MVCAATLAPRQRAESIKVLVVEDHLLVRHAIRAVLAKDPWITVVGEADDAEDALRIVCRVEPDVALIDIRLKASSGLELTRAIKKNHPGVKVLALSAYDFPAYLRAIREAGGEGYLLKTASDAELLDAVHRIRNGALVFAALPPRMTLAPAEVGAPSRTGRPRPLTGRELEILRLFSKTPSSRQIAGRLGISPSTVHSHAAHIMAKLGASSPSKALELATAYGLVQPYREVGQ